MYSKQVVTEYRHQRGRRRQTLPMGTGNPLPPGHFRAIRTHTRKKPEPAATGTGEGGSHG